MVMLERSLHGVLVLDFSRFAPGPFASLVLAELGAEVVKVEEPVRGDPMRGILRSSTEGDQPLFAMLNRGKKSVTLNLKSADGRRIAQRLAARADVLLEGFRPGVMERLDLDYYTLSRANPGLVYVSISGYGQSGPYGHRAGHDLNYLALGGFSALTGGAEGPPGLSAVPVADMVAGLWAVLGALSALWQRAGAGRGQHVDVGMLDSVVSLLAMPLGEKLAGRAVPAWGEFVLAGSRANYNVYETSDGRYMALGALELHFWQAFCLAVGRPEWIARHGEPDHSSLRAEVAALFREQPLAHWTGLFIAHDCCCEPVLDLAEVLTHPQVVARRVVHDGYLASPLSRHPLPPDSAPALGEHTAQILEGLGYGDDDRKRLRECGVI
jgi:crotonobetainyl-CoA:carnitine CoA-transferase CaiB-like acyl-CoA transferase